jgi:hypothetical protein
MTPTQLCRCERINLPGEEMCAHCGKTILLQTAVDDYEAHLRSLYPEVEDLANHYRVQARAEAEAEARVEAEAHEAMGVT